MRPKTAGSSRPPSSPNPPWHRHTAASNSPSNREVAHVELLERAAERPSAAAASRASRRNSARLVDADHRRTPGGPSDSE